MKENILISSDKKIEVLSGKKYQTNMSSENVKQVFNNVMESVSNGKKISISKEMRKAGYSDSSARAQKAKRTKTWKELEAKYLNEEKALQTLDDLADRENEDKRSRLEASKEIFKLKDRYPAGKLKIQEFNEQVGKYWDKEENLP
ncbi:MAG: hypothetical protein WC401_10685 [Bacteroidales bacterium]